MKDLAKELENKKTRLEQLIKARSKAYCSSVNSSAMDVQRETEIEGLEEEIAHLEKTLKTKH